LQLANTLYPAAARRLAIAGDKLTAWGLKAPGASRPATKDCCLEPAWRAVRRWIACGDA